MKKPPIPGANSTPCRQAVESGAPKDVVDVDFNCVSDEEEAPSGFEFTHPGPSTQRDPDDLYADAEQFLLVLGHDYRQSWFRTITPKKGANLVRNGGDTQFFAYDRLLAENQAGANVYLITGFANTASGISPRTGKPTGCVVDSDITHCTSFFVEWDDRPMEWQVNAWRELGLPEPSLMVETGGKSVHAYWRLTEPITPDVWKPIQKRLIAHCGSDPKCSNPSRLMRMPGFAYVDKETGQVTPNKSQLIHVSKAQYTLEQIEELLPAQQPELPPPVKKSLVKNPPKDWKPRCLEEIKAACRFIPERISGQPASSPHHYEPQRRALCGCAAALADAGVDDPEQMALDLLGDRWTSLAEAEQVLSSSDTRAAGSFWALAKEGGYDLTRKRPQPTKSPLKSKERPGFRKLGHNKAMRCFQRVVEIQATRERNGIRRQVYLGHAAKALKLTIKADTIAQMVLQAKDQSQGNSFQPLTAADRAKLAPIDVTWVLPGLVPAKDLTIIGGRPKVGKTRLAVAVTQAIRNQQGLFDYFAADSIPPVVLITDDQSDGDTKVMLDRVGLWEDDGLIWSRNFRLIERDLDRLLETIQNNPGAVVVIDSLRSTGRSLRYGENDAEIGAIIYDLKQVVTDNGGTLVLIHHCNKASDLVGTEALSGHNAIAGAANTVLTLHYCPDAKGNPAKDIEQRRLFREARSGQGLDIVISPTAGTGSFHKVMPFSEWQAQMEESKKEKHENETDRSVLDFFHGHSAEGDTQEFTRKDVVEGLNFHWGLGNGKDAKRISNALERLCEGGDLSFVVRKGSQKFYSLIA